MLAMIPQDFDVSPSAEDGDATLFTALRPDVWHIVVANPVKRGANFQTINITQHHWPRYSVARAVTTLAKSDGTPSDAQRLGIEVDKRGSLSLSLGENRFQIDPKLAEELRKDVPALKRAAKRMIESNSRYEVSDAESHHGHSVVTDGRCLAEAIAFERELRKTLDPRNFGVYSAFCTWRDFVCDDPLKRNHVAEGMSTEMAGWDPESIEDDEYWESVFDIQEQLFGHRIWGPGVRSTIDGMNQAFLRAFERLSSIQFAQFILMNGMHAGGPFHPLATLLGLMSFEDYKTWRTRQFQPDSPDEQEIRTHSSFIELLGIGDQLHTTSE
jgi:hypothetical protein